MGILRTLARYWATLLLAATLLLLGGAGGFGALQLRRVISLQLRADTVATICATLRHQQYDALANLVDPTPVASGATGNFDRQTFVAQLQSLDHSQGAVSACRAQPLQLDDERATYLFSLRRPHTPVPIGMLVALRRQPDNGWRIARSSPFTSDPV